MNKRFHNTFVKRKWFWKQFSVIPGVHSQSRTKAINTVHSVYRYYAIISIHQNVVTRSRAGLQIYEGRDDQLNRPGPMA
jgi:hypothetical protein